MIHDYPRRWNGQFSTARWLRERWVLGRQCNPKALLSISATGKATGTLGIELAHSEAVALAGVDLSQLNIYKRITATKCPELKSEY